jgi:tRNA pseudouridine38-40 synthase
VPRYKLSIAYDGTDFCGWQKQTPFGDDVPEGMALRNVEATGPAEGETRAVSEGPTEAVETRQRVVLRTVQEVVERAVRDVVREPIILMGASRTDSGVHARGQVGAFTCADGETRGIGWPVARGTEGMLRAVNSRLPRDVLVRAIEPAAENFNPIQGATRKLYTYTIWNGPTRPLWERRTAVHVWDQLNVAAMREAGSILEGEHDFAGFAAAGHGRMSTVRTVFACRVREEATGETDSRRIVFEVEGNGFLWNMVRIIAGTLTEAGRGRITPERIREALATGKRELAGPTMQPHGLCLEWIEYGERA